MDDQLQLAEILDRMEKANNKQVFYARLQCIFSLIAACCCIAVLVLGIRIMPQVRGLAEHANIVLSNLETVTEELAEVDLSGLEDVIDELAKLDMNSVVDNVNELVSATHEGVEETMEKLNAINFETLNKTIEDLSEVVERLAKIAKIFG